MSNQPVIRIQRETAASPVMQSLKWEEFYQLVAGIPFRSHTDITYFHHPIDPNLQARGLGTEAGLVTTATVLSEGDKMQRVHEVDAPPVSQVIGSVLLCANNSGGETVSIAKIFLTERAILAHAWAPTQLRHSIRDAARASTMGGETDNPTQFARVPTIEVPYQDGVFSHLPNDRDGLFRALELNFKKIGDWFSSLAEISTVCARLGISLDGVNQCLVEPYKFETRMILVWNQGRFMAVPAIQLQTRVVAPPGSEFSQNVRRSPTGERYETEWIPSGIIRSEGGQVIFSVDSSNTDPVALDGRLEQSAEELKIDGQLVKMARSLGLAISGADLEIRRTSNWGIGAH